MKYRVQNLMSANVVLTSKCNSRCSSCSYWKNEPEVLKKEKIVSFFDMIKKMNCSSVVLTGGEPMLHPQINEIVKIAKEEYDFVVILSTNGSLIDAHFDEVKNYIDSYCISFDGSSREQYKLIRGINNYDNILRNIDTIKNYNENIQVWLSCLIQRANHRNLLDIYNAGIKTGADGIFFNVPELRDKCFGRDGISGEGFSLMLNKSECNEFCKIIDEMIEEDRKYGFLCQNEESLSKFVNYFRMYNGEIKPEHRKCFVPYNTITLNEKGKIRPCFYLEDEFDMTGDDINSDMMIDLRRKLDENDEYKKLCDYCCQFNS